MIWTSEVALRLMKAKSECEVYFHGDKKERVSVCGEFGGMAGIRTALGEV